MKTATQQPLLKGALILIPLIYVKLISPTPESLTLNNTNFFDNYFWVAAGVDL